MISTVIGNEILKAQVKDTNSQFICKLLYRCGVTVKKVSIQYLICL